MSTHESGPAQETGETVGEAREPIYPSGPALDIPADAVQLTFLDTESLRRFQEERLGEIAGEGEAPSRDVPDPGSLELRTPLGIRIPSFEGPLDLLLHLIRRDKLDIYDIPIAHITEQYLAMLGVLQVLDLDVAGDFLVMAATLMRIKARLLLPTWPEDEDEEDPRGELVLQLLEYRRFKEAALALKHQEAERRRHYARGTVPRVENDAPVELAPLSHFALIDVMKDILSRAGEEFFYEVQLEDVTLEEKMALVSRELETKGRIHFVDLVSRYPRRMHVVVTFMAVLELARLGRLAVAQEANFGQIWLYPVREDVPATGERTPDAREATPEETDHGTT